jgi:putrescine aminotransferase
MDNLIDYESTLLDHHLPPFTDYKGLAKDGIRIISKASGNYIFDNEGNKILDAMAGLWCVNIGYGRDELAEVAKEQILRLPYYNSFFKTNNIPAAKLSKKLSEITPQGLNHTFFANSGSEANDTIIRMVRHYWALKREPQKRIIIGREYGYHGSTIMSASMGGMVDMHNQAAKENDFHHIPAPYSFKYKGNQSEDLFAETSSNWLEEKILELGKDKIAAFVAEPIQGAGGVIIPPNGYFEHIQEICKKYNILFIADEVITGFGRTGEWFASQKMNLSPDMMTLAKGLTSGYIPMSAVMVGEKVASTFIEEGGEFYHGFTYSGHPVAAAVALENLNIIERENLITKVASDTIPYFASKIKALNDHPLVGEARSFGLLACVELVKDKSGPELFSNVGETGMICRDFCIQNGLMMRAVRDGMIMSPALTITKNEIDEIINKFEIALEQTMKKII